MKQSEKSHKTKKTIMITLGIFAAGIAVAYLSTWGLTKYLDNQYASLHDGCQPTQIVHEITIKNNKAEPEHVSANRCEVLKVTNLDTAGRLMAFGVHDKHMSYDGISEKALSKGQSFTVTLIQTGNFLVHDHDDEEVGSTFEVK